MVATAFDCAVKDAPRSPHLPRCARSERRVVPPRVGDLWRRPFRGGLDGGF